ncbi:hypothetical protein OG552_26145 [Streptomyces sp. NBC_01476]|uniref:hypothetical protein n=1 Tax=Streptomyces sp. NBC_01476 TaxID=2903881 RepID=UPI002E32CA1F|nr:hypothetical protein [Streptomyces sp. NBC_01476]
MSTKQSAEKKSTVAKAKGFKKSKPGTYLAIGTSLISAVTNIKRARAARGESDTLKLVDAVVSAAAIATGVVLLVRELRRMNDDDILTD